MTSRRGLISQLTVYVCLQLCNKGFYVDAHSGDIGIITALQASRNNDRATCGIRSVSVPHSVRIIKGLRTASHNASD